MTPDYSKLSPETRKLIDQVEANSVPNKQLNTLKDIETVLEELVITGEKGQNQNDSHVQKVGSLLVDVRNTLTEIRDKEVEKTPDHATPVVEALDKLSGKLSSAIDKIQLNPTFTPNINVDAPQVNVAAAQVDLKGVEKILKDLPKAFDKAISTIDIPEATDNQPLLDALQGMSKQLSSIDTATRMKPQPGSMAISNLADINTESLTVKKALSEVIQVVDASNTYIGQAVPGTDTAAAAWRIKKIVVSGDTTTIYWADGDGNFTKQWTLRATYSYV